MFALARRDGDGVGANVRPRQSQQVAEPKAGMRGQVNRVCDIRRARLLQQRYIGFGPDDLFDLCCKSA